MANGPGPFFNHTREDGFYDPCPICWHAMTPAQRAESQKGKRPSVADFVQGIGTSLGEAIRPALAKRSLPPPMQRVRDAILKKRAAESVKQAAWERVAEATNGTDRAAYEEAWKAHDIADTAVIDARHELTIASNALLKACEPEGP